MMTRSDCAARDGADRLAPLRALFALERADQQGLIYLDGNSLGALPAAARARVQHVLEKEWGEGLVRSWNTAGWITLADRVAEKIARVIGADPREVVVADSTSVNLYKILSAAVAMVRADAPSRNRIVSERTNFPSDLYIAASVARAHGFELALAEQDDDITSYLDDRSAILLLTHVNYRTGRMHAMAEMTRAAHAAGALAIWDLAHSAGAVPIELHGSSEQDTADFAVGCGYKYLNGGPGAPAFAWADSRHLARMDLEAWRPPLSGWLGHAAPFAFSPEYEAGSGMSRFVCGTPPVLSLAALECGVDTVLAADNHGGGAAIRDKSLALTGLFIDLVDARCARHGLTLVTPRDPRARGSQVSLAHAAGGYAIMQALIARGVIGDFRAPDVLRFGFTPLYTRFVDVWDAVDRLQQVLQSGEWQDSRFSVRAAVT
jgi:kynureninase